MAKVTIISETPKNPITLMGERAGVCWGADITDREKNYKRGLDCIVSGHHRVMEYVNVEMIIDGYSARVIREWYTHVGGAPTRLQASTRYINYKDFEYIMPPTIEKNGVSNKTIMNYCYVLKKALKDYVDLQFNLLPIRNRPYGCFPISSFYGFHKWVGDLKTKLVFFVMVTGCRLSEIETCELVERNGRKYIKINGTKTENAVREVPAIPEAIEILKDVKKRITNKRIYKEATIKAGAFCGFTPEYIDENYIVFHSFRKMYKTLLVSCNVSNVYVEYLMGHSMTTNVDRLYFRPEAMDDAEYYKKVTEALKRFL